MSDMSNAFNHLRRFWSGKLNQKELAAELGVSIALANKFAKHNQPDDLPKMTDLPAKVNDIINETDFRITVRGHHTKCWIWDKNSMIIRDPVSSKKKYADEIIYRIYTGDYVSSGKVILKLCGQEKCINYEHFTIIRDKESDIIERIKERSRGDLLDAQKNLIKKFTKKYDWTETELCLIFRINALQIPDKDD